jgi:hypothetical protein
MVPEFFGKVQPQSSSALDNRRMIAAVLASPTLKPPAVHPTGAAGAVA